MSLTLQEISDRIEIQELLVNYAHAVDNLDFKAFAACFVPDAFIDYTAMRGPKGRLEEICAYLSRVQPKFHSHQHLMASIRIWLEKDRARSRTLGHIPTVLKTEDGSLRTMFYGLWYNDRLVRTAEGWRIQERITEFCYDHNVPEAFKAFE